MKPPSGGMKFLLFLPGPLISSGGSTGLWRSSATRKHKYLAVVPRKACRMRAVSQEVEHSWAFLEKIAHGNPQHSPPVGIEDVAWRRAAKRHLQCPKE